MTPVQVFSCEFCEFFKGTYLVEYLRTAASDRGFFSRTVSKPSKKNLRSLNASDIYCSYCDSEGKLATAV